MERKLKEINITISIIFVIVLGIYSEITENKFLLIVAIVYASFITIEIIADAVKLWKDKVKRKKDS